jgi:protein-S-isoprenylcysteine O-methyltransferase Ste14
MIGKLFKEYPPLCCLAALGIGLVLHYTLGKPLLLPLPLAFEVAMMLFILAVVLVAWALWFFWRLKTTWDPVGIPCALITKGPYRFTRNPGYLALLILMIGVAWWTRSMFLVLAAIAYLIILNGIHIPAEERVLESQFGEDYRRYCRSVRRWI